MLFAFLEYTGLGAAALAVLVFLLIRLITEVKRIQLIAYKITPVREKQPRPAIPR